MNLKDQVVVITGASSGIGDAVARDLHSAGMRLVITARREERLNALADELGADDVEVVAGDITDPALPQALIARAVERFGRCDIVFNNAGVIDIKPIDQVDIDKVCQMVRINVEAAYRMAHAALRHFQSISPKPRGHLVNTSSILGTKVRPTAGWYAGTKYAIEGLSEALRMELAGTDIAVSCVEPGLVLTELHADWETHPVDLLDIPNPLRPEDIARCVRFILEQPAHVRIPRLMALPGEHEI